MPGSRRGVPLTSKRPNSTHGSRYARYSKRLLRHRAAHKYKTEKMIPAATYLQKFYRGAAVRRVVRRMRLRLKSAKVLQAAWRNSLAVRAARERWRVLRQQFVYRTATKIQAAWRGMAARKRAEFERHRQAAAQIKPARQIQVRRPSVAGL